MARGDTIKRAFEIIKMFQAGPVTCRMISDRFKIHRHCSQKWIDNASLFMPIIEDGLDYSNGGKPGIVYRLLK